LFHAHPVRYSGGCIAVNEDGFSYTDYDNGKGCMICVEECPVKVIEGAGSACMVNVNIVRAGFKPAPTFNE